MLISANPDVRAMAEKGELKALHDRYSQIEAQVEADYLKTRDLISRIKQSVEDKENEIYDFLEEYVGKLKKEGHESVFDVLGLSGSSASIENLIRVNAFLETNQELENRKDFEAHRDKLHALLEVKAKYMTQLVNLHKDFVVKVTRGEKYSQSELDVLVN